MPGVTTAVRRSGRLVRVGVAQPSAAEQHHSHRDAAARSLSHDMSVATSSSTICSPAPLPMSQQQQQHGAAATRAPRPTSDGPSAAAADVLISALVNAALPGDIAPPVGASGGASAAAVPATLRVDRTLKPVAEFRPIDMRAWVPDAATSVCMSPLCEVPFTLFTRRHHCRGCGLVFCNACVRFTLVAPTMIVLDDGSVAFKTAAPPATATVDHGGAMPPNDVTPYRVCAVCFSLHQLAVGQRPAVGAHDGAHPFMECLVRPDLVRQTRFVSVDGCTAPGSNNGGVVKSGAPSSETSTTTPHEQQPTPPPVLLPKPTFVSYWTSRQRLAALRRRGSLRALPWGVLVAVAEFLPIIATPPLQHQPQALAATSDAHAADATAASIADASRAPPRCLGLFAYALACSDTYFASRANTVWSRWLQVLRASGSWMMRASEASGRWALGGAENGVDESGGGGGGEDEAAERTHHDGNALAEDVSFVGQPAEAPAVAASAPSTSSVDATPIDAPLVSPLARAATAPSFSRASTATTTMVNGHYTTSSFRADSFAGPPLELPGSAATTAPLLTAQPPPSVAPPFSVFSDFITAAAAHRADRLSAVSARLHRLLAGGVRLTLVGDDDALRAHLLRDFIMDRFAAAAAPVAAAASVPASSGPSLSSPSPPRASSSSSPSAALAHTSSDASSPVASDSAHHHHHHHHQDHRHSLALQRHSILGLVTHEQHVHVAIAASWPAPLASGSAAPESADGVPDSGGGGGTGTGASAMRQSFVRMYDVRSGQRYLPVARLAAKSSHAVVVCYDATSADSLARAALYFTEVASAVNTRVTLRILCGIVPAGAGGGGGGGSHGHARAGRSVIDAAAALAFVGYTPASKTVVSLVCADDAVDVFERIVQAVFTKAVRGPLNSDATGGRRRAAGDSAHDSEGGASNGGRGRGDGVDGAVLALPTVLDVLCSDTASEF
jgi:hypothetical protein